MRLSYKELAQGCALGLFYVLKRLYAPEHTLDHPGGRQKKERGQRALIAAILPRLAASNRKQPSINPRTEPTEAYRSLRLMRLQEPKGFIQRTREYREDIGSIVISQFIG